MKEQSLIKYILENKGIYFLKNNIHFVEISKVLLNLYIKMKFNRRIPNLHFGDFEYINVGKVRIEFDIKQNKYTILDKNYDVIYVDEILNLLKNYKHVQLQYSYMYSLYVQEDKIEEYISLLDLTEEGFFAKKSYSILDVNNHSKNDVYIGHAFSVKPDKKYLTFYLSHDINLNMDTIKYIMF